MTRGEYVRKNLPEQLAKMRGQAVRLTRSNPAADDLVQTTALKALEYADTFTPGTNFSAWVYRIMTNAHVDMWRKRNRRCEVGIEKASDCDLGKDGGQDAIVYMHDVNKAMDLISVEQKQMLLLLGQRYTYDEMAAITGVPVGTVKSRLWRGREALLKAVA